MKKTAHFLLLTSILAVLTAVSLRADNYLKNADLKEGISFFRGDGKIAYLKPDGTEGEETDTDVTPVIKLELSSGVRRTVMQEFEARDTPISMHIRVDIMASKDFKRSDRPEDYTDFGLKNPHSGRCGDPFIPNIDFMVILGPDFYYTSANAKLGVWTTIDHRFEEVDKDEDRAINYCVPFGHGSIYLKNFVVEK